MDRRLASSAVNHRRNGHVVDRQPRILRRKNRQWNRCLGFVVACASNFGVRKTNPTIVDLYSDRDFSDIAARGERWAGRLLLFRFFNALSHLFRASST